MRKRIAFVLLAATWFCLRSHSAGADDAIRPTDFADRGAVGEETLADPAALHDFYIANGDRPVWRNAGESRALLAVFAGSWQDGLNPARYHAAALRALLDGPQSKARRAASDVLLTDAIMRYGHDMTGMRIDASRDGVNAADWRQPLDGRRILPMAARAGDPAQFLAGLAPRDALYQLMRKEMKRLAGDRSLPAVGHARQLVANMERMRWLEPARTGRYVLVNIPSRILWAVADDRIVSDMPVQVGGRGRPTPVLKATMRGVHFQNGHLQVIMPNIYDVDLHDAGAPEGEDNPYSGVTVSAPADLAMFLIGGQKGWSAARVAQALASRRTGSVAADGPLPLYIVDQTVWPDGQGGLVYGPDVYGGDARLLSLLDAGDVDVLPR